MTEIYHDPDDFEIDSNPPGVWRRMRDEPPLYGYGIHFCLVGASLARIEGRVALEEILARWTEWEIGHAGAEMARTSTVRGWKRLPARLQSRR